MGFFIHKKKTSVVTPLIDPIRVNKPNRSYSNELIISNWINQIKNPDTFNARIEQLCDVAHMYRPEWFNLITFYYVMSDGKSLSVELFQKYFSSLEPSSESSPLLDHRIMEIANDFGGNAIINHINRRSM